MPRLIHVALPMHRSVHIDDLSAILEVRRYLHNSVRSTLFMVTVPREERSLESPRSDLGYRPFTRRTRW